MPERRAYLRLGPSSSSVISSAGEFERLVDVSPTGLSAETRDAGGLAQGDRHLFIVQDKRGCTFEVLGEVRWRRALVEGPERELWRVGIAFAEVLRDDPQGTWAGISPYRELRGQRHLASDELDTVGVPHGSAPRLANDGRERRGRSSTGSVLRFSFPGRRNRRPR